MILVVKLFASALIVALFIYSKLLIYEKQLAPKYLKTFNRLKSILQPILKFLGQFFKPYKIGDGLSIDLSQFIFLIILLLILRI